MIIFITGINGQLGSDIAKESEKRKYTVIGCGTKPNTKHYQYIQLDITNRDKVFRTIEFIRADIIIHCAAWTDVDKAELIENKNKVYDINKNGTTWLAEAARNINAKMIYFSTDYVFNGNGTSPWAPNDIINPLNWYGFTKSQGELKLQSSIDKYFIIRISWVFGQNGKNFVKTMQKLSEKYNSLTIVNDQIGRPTYTVDLAKLVCDMMITDKYGIYHASNSGEYISWYDFATEIFKQINKSIELKPVSSEEYQALAVRPKNSRLDISKLEQNGFELLPDWKDALRRYLNECN